VVAGEGLFFHQLRRALRPKGIQVPFQEHDLPLASAFRVGAERVDIMWQGASLTGEDAAA
jgi:hypothetical protein